MARHRINPRLVKIHLSYTVDEAARRLRTHKNTIRNWIKLGLPVIDGRRPALVHGRDLAAFIDKRRQSRKQPCPPGHLYCVKCRTPRSPAGQMADYVPMSENSGMLKGLCPECFTLMHRRIAQANLDVVRRNLEIAFPKGDLRLRERSLPSLNCDSTGTSETDGDVQP